MLSLSSVNCRYSKLTNPKLDLTLLSGLEIFSIDSVLFHAWTLWFYVTKYWWFHIFIQLDLEHYFVFPDTQTDIVKTRLMWLWHAMIPAQNFLWQENWLLVFFLSKMVHSGVQCLYCVISISMSLFIIISRLSECQRTSM